MLTYREHPDYYEVIENSFEWGGTKITKVKFSKDLQYKRVNNDPWQETTKGVRRWFNKYYRKHFEGMKNA